MHDYEYTCIHTVTEASIDPYYQMHSHILSIAAFPTRGMFLKTQEVKKTHKSQEY